MTLLSELEVASGLVLGTLDPSPRLPRPTGDLLGAFERAVVPALQRPPCLVSFSGGRDSSLVLAVATRAARREGLPDPIPATNRVPGAPAADEREWQERVVAHLGLRDWVRLEFERGELDALGPYARATLRRHGLVWPFNLHFHSPLLEAARGGALLTGIAGDELFASACRLRRGRVRGAARAVAPAALRRQRLAADHRFAFPWLSETGRRATVAASVAQDAAEPLRLRARMRWVHGFRYLHVGIGDLDRLGDDADVTLAHPLADAQVWAELGAVAAPRRFADRTAIMRALFPALLPDVLLARTSKAHFDEVFWGPASRAFARGWTGGGVPAGLVDERALREHWASADPLPQSLTLLQAAWLASIGEGVDESAGNLGQDVEAPRAAQAPYGA